MADLADLHGLKPIACLPKQVEVIPTAVQRIVGIVSREAKIERRPVIALRYEADDADLHGLKPIACLPKQVEVIPTDAHRVFVALRRMYRGSGLSELYRERRK